jgi:hypothetical protein
MPLVPMQAPPTLVQVKHHPAGIQAFPGTIAVDPGTERVWYSIGGGDWLELTAVPVITNVPGEDPHAIIKRPSEHPPGTLIVNTADNRLWLMDSQHQFIEIDGIPPHTPGQVGWRLTVTSPTGVNWQQDNTFTGATDPLYVPYDPAQNPFPGQHGNEVEYPWGSMKPGYQPIAGDLFYNEPRRLLWVYAADAQGFGGWRMVTYRAPVVVVDTTSGNTPSTSGIPYPGGTPVHGDWFVNPTDGALWVYATGGGGAVPPLSGWQPMTPQTGNVYVTDTTGETPQTYQFPAGTTLKEGDRFVNRTDHTNYVYAEDPQNPGTNTWILLPTDSAAVLSVTAGDEPNTYQHWPRPPRLGDIFVNRPDGLVWVRTSDPTNQNPIWEMLHGNVFTGYAGPIPADLWFVTSDTLAIAGNPGQFIPAGMLPADLPALQALGSGILTVLTPWTSGQHLVLGDSSKAHWDGTHWVAGAVPIVLPAGPQITNGAGAQVHGRTVASTVYGDPCIKVPSTDSAPSCVAKATDGGTGLILEWNEINDPTLYQHGTMEVIVYDGAGPTVRYRTSSTNGNMLPLQMPGQGKSYQTVPGLTAGDRIEIVVHYTDGQTYTLVVT